VLWRLLRCRRRMLHDDGTEPISLLLCEGTDVQTFCWEHMCI
jgi:hypothetical protein